MRLRFKSAKILSALALLTLASAHARAQTQPQGQDDKKVVDDFVTQRGIIFDAPKPAASKPKTSTRRRQGSSLAKTKTPPNGVKQGGGATAGSADTAQQQQKARPADSDAGDAEPSGVGADGVQIIKAGGPQRLGFGYTIYLKDKETGTLLPVPASKSYKTRDSIVLGFEPTEDGYLYVFNAENGKNPEMIYPDARLRGGTNEVRAHVPEVFPDTGFGFDFEDPPATEHFYIVVSRAPLEGLPTGGALVKFCGKDPDACKVRPTAALWERISAAALDRKVVEARSTLLAQADTQPAMPVMLQRSIRLKRDAPPPAVVRVSDSPAAAMLVTKIELMHK
jgi:hypothetical protein